MILYNFVGPKLHLTVRPRDIDYAYIMSMGRNYHLCVSIKGDEHTSDKFNEPPVEVLEKIDKAISDDNL